MRRLVCFVMLLYYSTRSVADYSCYSDYCQNVTEFIPTPGFQCLLTRVKKGEVCRKYISDDNIQSYPENTKSNFTLRAYVSEINPGFRYTAFNLSVTGVDFQELVTYYQWMDNKNELYCRKIRFYGNETYPAPKELYISCPFANDTYENKNYRLKYIVTGERYKYRKQYMFRVPDHMFFGGDISIREYMPFVYVDISDKPVFSLHIQPLPDSYNVTMYKVWLMQYGSDWFKTFDVRTGDELRYDFSSHTGYFYFKVAPMHPTCGDYGCANSTTPLIERPSQHLLLMMVSIVWIPPMIMLILHKFYREVLRRRRRPRCLLLYVPSRSSHTTVMRELEKYLRNCNIDVVILEINATDITGEDPEHMDTALRNADVILLAVSPPPEKPMASSIYRNANSYLLRLMDASQSRTKRYYIVQLPYCKSDDVLEEANSNVTVICLPKELPKLIKLIHGHGEYVFSASDKEFLDSLKTVKLEFFDEDPNVGKDERETENLLSSETTEVSKDCNDDSRLISTNKSEKFTLNIHDLDLLGENTNSDQTCTRNNLTNNGCAIRLDQLIT
ncbi:uncharacterized protein LOC108629272 isoform X2 [Ceratina calcarata]|uniref:Uncharacterized protein LOC108629272 isoform X2 n=1 Tax=Ceratina calcarata TaxID=156304 RepID=A0AAJ7NBQ0_9HYME|nr:uncharacterized protein LOC108629272 isoform X2 [Ceratina calcarata]